MIRGLAPIAIKTPDLGLALGLVFTKAKTLFAQGIVLGLMLLTMLLAIPALAQAQGMSLSPNVGPLSGGTAVTVTITDPTINALSLETLRFNGVSIPYTIVNATRFTFVTPPGVALGDYQILGNFAVGGVTAAIFTYAAPPTITSFTPSTGTKLGGVNITLTGTGFTNATSLSMESFSSVVYPITNFTVVNDTTITAILPATPSGMYGLKVTTPNGSAESDDAYTALAPSPILTSVSPNSGPTAGGNTVTITGLNLSFPVGAAFYNQLSIDGVFLCNADANSCGTSARFNVSNDTTLVAVMPPHPEGPVNITFRNETVTPFTLVGAYTYADRPSITSITPDAGFLEGGDVVTLSGTNFIDVSRVTIGGVDATQFTVVSSTEITATVPRSSIEGLVTIDVITELGTATLSNGYRYISRPVFTSISPDRGPAAGGTPVTIRGTGFDTVTGILIGVPIDNFTVVNSTTITGVTRAQRPIVQQIFAQTLYGSFGAGIGNYTYLSPYSITTTTLSTTAGVTASLPILTNGGAGAEAFRLTAGSLPVGLTLSSSGVISGTATEVGSFSFTVSATDEVGFPGPYTATKVITLTVAAPIIVIDPTTLSSGIIGTAYSTTLTSTGGTGPYVYSTADTLPSGLTLSREGVLSGNPSRAGNFNFIVRSTDATTGTGAPFSGTRTFAVTITDDQAPTILSLPGNITRPSDPGLPTAIVTWTAPTATDNAAGATITQTAGPASGSAFPIGVTTITYTATDAAQNRTVRSFTVTVTDALAPVINNLPANISVTITVPTTTAQVSWTPPTATDNQPGVSLAQTAGPTSGGAFPIGVTTVTYVATDASNNRTTQSFTVTVIQIQTGTVSFVVRSEGGGIHNFTSATSALNLSVTPINGMGTSSAIALTAGTYSFAFNAPEGLGFTEASCSASTGAINLQAKTGQVTIVPGQNLICTLQSLATRSETRSQIGNYSSALSNFILSNEPDLGRRIDRLNTNSNNFAAKSTKGSVTVLGFNAPLSLPAKVTLNQGGANFSYSLLQSMSQKVVANDKTDKAALTSDSTMVYASGETVAAKPAPKVDAEALVVTPKIDLWAEGLVAQYEASGGKGRFSLLHIGADYLITPKTLIGFGFQADWGQMKATRNSGRIKGDGYLAGPYMITKLDKGLYFDARLAMGKSDNRISPFGTYQDTYSSDRKLLSAALIGQYQSGNMLIRPEGRLVYYTDTSKAYTDSLNVTIPSVKVATGQFKFGPEITWLKAKLGNTNLTPTLKLQGIWTFKHDNNALTQGANSERFEKGLRARLESGLIYNNPKGISTYTSVFYDGIGRDDFKTWGLKMQLRKGF
jgi:outer membrane autotransporter protein